MNKLEHYRTKEGFTQAELAEKSGIDQAKISRVEKGIVDLTGQQWRVMAEIFGCTVDELLTHRNL